ncbi:unnamed protein product [Parajaminaea phylloscopi]
MAARSTLGLAGLTHRALPAQRPSAAGSLSYHCMRRAAFSSWTPGCGPNLVAQASRRGQSLPYSWSQAHFRFSSTKTGGVGDSQSRDQTQPEVKDESKGAAAAESSLASRLVVRVRDAFLQSASKAASRSGTGSGSENTIAPPTYPDFKRLFSLAAPERKTLVLGLALLLVSAGITLTVPFTIGKVIDFFTASVSPEQEGKGEKGEKTVYGLGFKSVAALLVFVFAVGAATRASSSILLNLAGVRIVQRIRERCFGNAIKQEVEWADKSHGDVISRLSVDTSIVGDAVTYELGDGLRAGLTVIFSGTTMFLISPSLTLLMMAVVPPAAIGAVFYGRYLRDLTNKVQEAVGQMTRNAEERLNSQAFRTVTAFNAQKAEERRFAEKVRAIAQLETKETFATGFFYAGTGFVGNCSILVLLTYGGTLVSRGVITVGDLTSLLMYTAYLGGGLANLTSFFASLMKGVGAGARVFQLVDRQSEIELEKGRELTNAEKKSARIEFKDVKFHYPSRPGVQVLNGVNLTIEKGESVALVGGSGVGKSSVHALLLRYYDPNQGAITFGGADLTEVLPSSLRDQLAVVTQDPILFAGTLFENIAYGCDPPASRQQVEEAARMANCWEFIGQLPQGLDTEIGARQLSGGQRQRVAIARALCRKPQVLLLDEATSALDAASEYLVNQSISEIIRQGEITVWIVAHRLSTIRSAQRIMVLQDGAIVETGSFEELDHAGSAFRKLVGSQIERDGEDDAETADTEYTESGISSQNDQRQSNAARAIPARGQVRSMHTSRLTRSAFDPVTRKPLSFGASPSHPDHPTTPSHPALPSEPTWSVHSLLEFHDLNHPSATFSTESLRKLHQLCALQFPEENEEEISKLKEELRESKRLIDLLKDDDQYYRYVAKKLDGAEPDEIIDGRVHDAGREESDEKESQALEHRIDVTTTRAEASGIGTAASTSPDQTSPHPDGTGVLDTETLLSHAQMTRGGYFVVEGTGRRQRQKEQS